MSMTSINVSSGNPYDRTNLIVGLRFRGLRGPVDQPGTQRVRAGRRSPAWQVILDPECGKALTLLRRAAGSNPARSTTKRFWREVRVGPRGPERFTKAVSRTCFRNLVIRKRDPKSDSNDSFRDAVRDDQILNLSEVRVPRCRPIGCRAVFTLASKARRKMLVGLIGKRGMMLKPAGVSFAE